MADTFDDIAADVSFDTPEQRQNAAYNFFQNKGWAPHQAAGIVGNLWHESGMKTKAMGDKGAAYGLAQWSGPRRRALQEFAKATKADPNDFMTQLQFIHSELEGSESGAGKALRQTTDVDSATKAFSEYYERPGKPMMSSRLSAARKVSGVSGLQVDDSDPFGDIAPGAEIAGAAALGWPVQGTISPHGTFSDTRDKGSRQHNAGDILATAGTPVTAPEDMELIDGGLGGQHLKDNDGWAWFRGKQSGKEYRFAHISGIGNLKPGDVVPAGQQWSTVGNAISGTHLHMAIRDKDGKPIDWLKQAGLKAGAAVSGLMNLLGPASAEAAEGPPARKDDPFGDIAAESTSADPFASVGAKVEPAGDFWKQTVKAGEDVLYRGPRPAGTAETVEKMGAGVGLGEESIPQIGRKKGMIDIVTMAAGLINPASAMTGAGIFPGPDDPAWGAPGTEKERRTLAKEYMEKAIFPGGVPPSPPGLAGKITEDVFRMWPALIGLTTLGAYASPIASAVIRTGATFGLWSGMESEEHLKGGAKGAIFGGTLGIMHKFASRIPNQIMSWAARVAGGFGIGYGGAKLEGAEGQDAIRQGVLFSMFEMFGAPERAEDVARFAKDKGMSDDAVESLKDKTASQQLLDKYHELQQAKIDEFEAKQAEPRTYMEDVTTTTGKGKRKRTETKLRPVEVYPEEEQLTRMSPEYTDLYLRKAGEERQAAAERGWEPMEQRLSWEARMRDAEIKRAMELGEEPDPSPVRSTSSLYGPATTAKDFAATNVPVLEKFIGDANIILKDTNAFSSSKYYDGSFPIPREGGIEAAKETHKYATDPEYKAKVDAVVDNITSDIVNANRKLGILRDVSDKNYMFSGGPDTSKLFDMIRAVAKGKPPEIYNAVKKESEKVRATFGVNVSRAWYMEAKQKYGSYNLGDIAVREGLQNSLDAVLEAMELGQVKKGLIKIDITEDNRGFTFDDNGVGMSDTDIRDKFLALHGTGKDKQGRFGGFGIAKAVILGPHDTADWTLHTRDNVFSKNAATNFEQIGTGKKRQGTKISVNTDEDHVVTHLAKRFVETTELPKGVDVTYNGEALKFPFTGLRNRVEFSGPVSDSTKMKVTYYPTGHEVSRDYDKRVVLRLVDKKTGAKLTQALQYVFDSNFKGTLVADVETTATPGTGDYPLADSRNNLRGRAEAEIEKIVKKHTVDTASAQRAGIQTTTAAASSIAGWGPVIGLLSKDKEVVDMQSDFSNKAGGVKITPVNEIEVAIDAGRMADAVSPTKDQLRMASGTEALLRLAANELGVPLDKFYLLYPETTAGTTVAAQWRNGKDFGLNLETIPHEAYTNPVDCFFILKDMVDHELTHHWRGPHDEKYVMQYHQTLTKTGKFMDKILDIAELVTAKVADSVRTIKIGRETEPRTVIPGKQLEMFAEKQGDPGYGRDPELFTPTRGAGPEAERTLPGSGFERTPGQESSEKLLPETGSAGGQPVRGGDEGTGYGSLSVGEQVEEELSKRHSGGPDTSEYFKNLFAKTVADKTGRSPEARELKTETDKIYVRPVTSASLLRNLGEGARSKLAPETRSEQALQTGMDWVRFMNGARAEDLKARQLVDAYKKAFSDMDNPYALSSKMERGETVPPEWQPYANLRKQMYDRTYKLITDPKEGGGLERTMGYVKNYAVHMFRNHPDDVQRVLVNLVGRRPLEGSKGFLKGRARGPEGQVLMPDMETCIEHGLVPLFDNPAVQDIAGLMEQWRFIAANKFINELESKGLYIPIDKEGNAAREVPDGYRRSDNIFRPGWAHPDTLDIIQNHLTPDKGNLWYNTYRDLTAAWNAWHVAWSAFHGMATTIHEISMGFGQGIPDFLGAIAAGDVAAATRAAKGLGPLRVAQSLVTGMKGRDAFYNPGKYGPEIDNLVRLATDGGLLPDHIMAFSDTAANTFGEFFQQVKGGELGSAFRSLIHIASKPIMGFWVPTIKYGSTMLRMQREFEKLAKDYKTQYGDNWTPDVEAKFLEDQRHIAYNERQYAENIFGEIQYDNLHWSKGFKKGLSMLIGYPGWNVGTARWIAGMGRGMFKTATGKPLDYQARRSLQFGLGLILTNAIANTILHMAMNDGQFPEDWKDVMIGARTGRTLSNGAPERIGVASYMKDLMGLRHPVRMAEAKLQFPFQLYKEITNNADFFGVEVMRSRGTPLEKAGDVIKYGLGKAAVPFGLSNVDFQDLYNKYQEGRPVFEGGRSPIAQFGGLVGIRTIPREYTNTTAQNRIDELLRAKLPHVRTKQQAEMGRLISELKELGWAGNRGDMERGIRDAQSKGLISREQANRIRKDVIQDKAEVQFGKLDLEGMLEVFALGSPDEKTVWRPVLFRRIRNAKPHTKQKLLDQIQEALRQ